MSNMDIKTLLKQFNQDKGSDLFITVGLPPELKVHGDLRPIGDSPLSQEQVESLLWSIMTDKNKATFMKSHECNFAISDPVYGRFRVSAFQQRNQFGCVIRRIETQIPTIQELGLPLLISELALTKRGLIIFVGATGSGKSTSLAAMIGFRNQNSKDHIISIEDPIEYVHQHGQSIITQREVGIDTESFEVALKNTLRQAPDVIFIGEIRSSDTMEHAIAFAETGHLCLSTLHANNANQAIDRILSFFPEDKHNQVRMDLSLNLRAVVAQQLIPLKDNQGRCAAVEIMLNSPLVADLIRKGEVHKIKDVMKKSYVQGMLTFDQALFNLYKAGQIDYDEALRHADSENELRLMVKLNKPHGDEDDNGSMRGVSVLE